MDNGNNIETMWNAIKRNGQNMEDSAPLSNNAVHVPVFQITRGKLLSFTLNDS